MAWEEFIQDPDKGGKAYNLVNPTGTHDEETWDRWGLRVNLGYFLVPRKWEVTFKYAYLVRLDDNTPLDSRKSGLGLVKFDDGKLGVEDYLQQFVLGVNYYLHGFNQYITCDISLLQLHADDASPSEAAAIGKSASDFDSGTQDDWRFRVMYQHWF